MALLVVARLDIAGLILLFIDNAGLRILGIVILGTLCWLFYNFQQNKTRTRYGLAMRLNAGITDVIVSGDIEFLKRVILVLYNIMNDDEIKAINVNFDQRKIEYKSISADQMLVASNVVTGNVSGDVVMNVI